MTQTFCELMKVRLFFLGLVARDVCQRPTNTEINGHNVLCEDSDKHGCAKHLDMGMFLILTVLGLFIALYQGSWIQFEIHQNT
ncbi:unnamed protein product [Staurois parvus]|uniref:Uncharacterized protein n=1 Tax=Staurois parvus TaxID=386267 RepID=A0ABN9CKB2_9NEOB|nr:unnamed protein product [Staurois parvus]